MSNLLGGKNENSIYTPMSETEQEVLSRVAKDLRVEIVGWGFVTSPQVVFGDKRISIMLSLAFNAPAQPMPVHFFHIRVFVDSLNLLVHDKKYPTVNGGSPILVGAGLVYDMALDIAIDHMKPEFVKAVMPGAVGLTTRRLDATTGQRTIQGNARLTDEQKRMTAFLDKQDAAMDRMDADNLKKVENL